MIYPDYEQGADRFVITGLKCHVTFVMLLFDVLPFPQDSVAPCGHTTFLT